MSEQRTFGTSVEAASWAYGALRREDSVRAIFNYDNLRMPEGANVTPKRTGMDKERVKDIKGVVSWLSSSAKKAFVDMIPMTDTRSTALTVVAVIERVQPMEHQVMFRYLFGDRDEVNVMMLYLQDALVQQGILHDRHHNVINTVISQLLRRQHSWAHRTRSKVDVNDLAKIYRMRKDTFKQKCVRPLEETMRMWQDMADRKITDELSDKGIIV